MISVSKKIGALRSLLLQLNFLLGSSKDFQAALEG